MSWRWSGSGLLMLGGAACFAVCALYVRRFRRSVAAGSLLVVLLATAEWSIAYALELTGGDLATRQLWGDLKYIGICLLPPAWLIFVLEYTGRWRPGRFVLSLLAAEPVAVLTLLAVPSTHALIRSYPPGAPPETDPIVQTGPLFWVHFAYANALIWTGIVVFVVSLARTSRLYRWQSLVLFASQMLPWLANLLFNLNVGPFGRVDLTPFAFSFTAVVLVWGVFRFNLLGLRPIARRRIFQTIADGVVVLDLDGKVIDANPAAERLVGQPAAQAVGQPVERLAPAWAGLVARQRERGGEAVEEAATAGRTYEVAISSLTDHQGRPTGQLLVARDVTERRRVERQLRDSLEREQAAIEHLRGLDQTKTAFLQALSHDLRTPLASVLGIAVTLQRRHRELPQADAADLLRRLCGSARRLDRLLTDLLDLDRLTQPTVTAQRRPVDLGALVARVLDQAPPELLDGRPVRLDVRSLQLAVDAPKVERIVENLLANAARHTPAGTPVWVRVEARDHGALLVVEDAGPGVPEELREAVFQPFSQGPGTASHAPGLGVGLALVRLFAKLHGGHAWVEERDGRGASFRVLLPDLDRPNSPRRPR